MAGLLDSITLDQLRMLIAVADSGSFSAAARRLQRVQSAVSSAMSKLEQQLGVAIWDRSSKIPQLTDAGRGVLAAARRVGGGGAAPRVLARALHDGVEAALPLCVDQLLPTAALVGLCRDFAARFPAVDLRVDSQSLAAVS